MKIPQPTVRGPFELLISRLSGVRGAGFKYMARCPAHKDGSPSLSVRQTSDGVILVKCFAGCQSGEILRAVGLRFRDLFPRHSKLEERRANDARVRRCYRAKPEIIREMLARESERQRLLRLKRYPFDTTFFRAADLNAARRSLSHIFGIELRTQPPFEWETCAPHDQDPLWPLCYQRAKTEAFWQGRADEPIFIEDRAVQILREFTHVGSVACARI